MSNGDIVVVIGGDGTFLSAVRERYRDNPYFIGLNSGNLGFFSEFQYADTRKLVQLLAHQKYDVVEYPLYEVEITQKNGFTQRDIFFNDISVERIGTTSVHLEATINRTNKLHYSVDGLIVTTSLGSGAYSMSNNGTVSMELTPTIQLTPVSQVRNNKYRGPANSILLNDTSIVEIEPEFKKKRRFRVVADGRELKCRQPQKVKIYKSKHTFKVIRSKQFNYSTHVLEKLF
ncbi:NAD(+)/NADH kinase [Priestia filamentosa]